jgi:NAD(P)-dependent dehydrogenase (short-subunit alcohol dehydrogenase family)
VSRGGSSAEVDAPVCNTGGRRFESDAPPLESGSAAVDAPTSYSEDVGSNPTRSHDLDIAGCIATLEALHEVAPDDPRFVAVERAAAHLAKSAKKKRRLERKHERVAHDREATQGSTRAAAYFAVPALAAEIPRVLRAERRCYICKQPFRRLHAFYHALCPTCADRNFAARGETADLRGRRAIVTGGRMKIGFETARMLHAAGARVTITTRFPRDAERRFAEAGILGIAVVGLDFRDLRGLYAWLDAELAAGEPLDLLINNAAQTVRRPPAYYAALVAAEQGQLAAPEASDLALFPPGIDEEGKPLDLRARNSWVLDAADVEPLELVEAHVINAIAPFAIASRLRPLLCAAAAPDRYIVNVSAMEGVFSRYTKTDKHPHTNMAKAALNMMTFTSAPDYAEHGIFMNAVDTGWVTDEDPILLAERKTRDSDFQPPLDIVDGAARICDPFFSGLSTGEHAFGKFFKDYKPTQW